MNRLRIAIDPRLAAAHGPEIHWTLRLLLSTMGWAWEEVAPGSECEVALVADLSQAPTARLCIQANPASWAQPRAHRGEGAGQCQALSFPLLQNELASDCPLQVDDGRVTCRRDLIFDVFWLVTGQEERHWPKDRHGFFDLTSTWVLRAQALRQALASQISGWLERTLLDLGCPPPTPRWPGGKRAAAGAGHDVDYPEVVRWLEPLRIVMRQGRPGLQPALEVLAGRRSHWHFSDWVEFEKRLQTRSAFYFVARRGSLFEYAAGTPDSFYDVTSGRFQRVLRSLIEAGFEVGLHASYLAYQSREKFAAEKHRLEEASGHPVAGNRHHYWHLNPHDVEETLLIHEHVGLAYDSSLIHERYLGWRRGLAHPFFPFHQQQRRELRTLQVPVAWMDDQLFGHWNDGQGDRFQALQELADRAALVGGCLLVDVHDYVFDDVLFPGWRQAYRRLWEHLLGRGDFWIATPAEIAGHWAARHAALVQASHGLQAGRA